MIREIGHVDGILISGDIAFAGKVEEYDIARAWLTKLSSILGCDPGYVWCVRREPRCGPVGSEGYADPLGYLWRATRRSRSRRDTKTSTSKPRQWPSDISTPEGVSRANSVQSTIALPRHSNHGGKMNYGLMTAPFFALAWHFPRGKWHRQIPEDSFIHQSVLDGRYADHQLSKNYSIEPWKEFPIIDAEQTANTAQ